VNVTISQATLALLGSQIHEARACIDSEEYVSASYFLGQAQHILDLLEHADMSSRFETLVDHVRGSMPVPSATAYIVAEPLASHA